MGGQVQPGGVRRGGGQPGGGSARGGSVQPGGGQPGGRGQPGGGGQLGGSVQPGGGVSILRPLAGGMPLAFTQEDFLVFNDCVHILRRQKNQLHCSPWN